MKKQFLIFLITAITLFHKTDSCFAGGCDYFYSFKGDSIYCPGQSIYAELYVYGSCRNGYTPQMDWFKNGIQVVGFHQSFCIARDTGTYICYSFIGTDTIYQSQAFRIKYDTNCKKPSLFSVGETNYSNDSSIRTKLFFNLNFDCPHAYGINYQWYRDFVKLDSDTESSMIARETGTYQCRFQCNLDPYVFFCTDGLIISRTNVPKIYSPFSSLDVFPNPFSDAVKVSFSTEKSDLVEWKIFNEIGLEVLSDQYQKAPGIDEKLINLDFLPSGLYFLQLQTKDVSVHKKLLKLN